MTFHIRHHTEQAQAWAAMRTPSQKLANAPFPPAYEGAYAGAMLRLAKKERRKGRLPLSPVGRGGPEVSDVSLAVMEVISGEMTSTEIAKAVSKRLGRRISTQTVLDRLRGCLSTNDKVKMREIGKRKYVWSAIPQHIGAERPAKQGAV